MLLCYIHTYVVLDLPAISRRTNALLFFFFFYKLMCPSFQGRVIELVRGVVFLFFLLYRRTRDENDCGKITPSAGNNKLLRKHAVNLVVNSS